MKFCVHGVTFLRQEIETDTQEEAARIFVEQNPESNVQGVEVRDGEFVSCVGTCETCKQIILQNSSYEITDEGVRHEVCPTFYEQPVK